MCLENKHKHALEDAYPVLLPIIGNLLAPLLLDRWGFIVVVDGQDRTVRAHYSYDMEMLQL